MSITRLDTRPATGHGQTRTQQSIPGNPGFQPLSPKDQALVNGNPGSTPLSPKDRALVTGNPGFTPLTPKEWEAIAVNPGFKALTPQQRAAAAGSVMGLGTVRIGHCPIRSQGMRTALAAVPVTRHE
jgi:hypothetical protein